MMSSMMNRTDNLNQHSLSEHVKQQLFYKIKMHTNLFSGLVFYQGLFIVFSMFLPYHNIGMSGESHRLEVSLFSGSNVISVTLFWGLIIGLIVANKKSKELMNVVVMDKWSNHLANCLLLVILSIVGGVTAFLADNVVKIGIVLIKGIENIGGMELLSLQEMCIGIFVTILYILFVMTISYCVGVFYRMNQWLTLLIIVVISMLLVTRGIILMELFFFYFNETNVILFCFKIIVSCLLLLFATISINRRLEVA